MAGRKLQQEIDKCFKQVAIGVEAFDEQFEKYTGSSNPSQRDKLVDNLKKECKKLQRLRDQIKSWAQSNEVKDKGPLQEKRELIETKMETFKAVEKEMKTKAFSKEGLSLAAKLDPREQEKEEIITFLTNAIDSLGHQVEEHEANISDIKARLKKVKKGGNADQQSRMSSLEKSVEQNKMHQGKLELLLRGVENDSIESQRVKDDLQENIQDYVDNNQEADFDPEAYEGLYDDFGLDEEEAQYGVPLEPDRVVSHEDSSIGDPIEHTVSNEEEGHKKRTKSKSGVDISAPHRRPSQQIKSPLPTLATLHTQPPPAAPNTSKDMKPAPPPKPAGEPLRYASAAAAATATDKAGIGIAPLPAPSTQAATAQAIANTGLTPQHPEPSARSSSTTSPAATHAAPADPRQSAVPGAGVLDKNAPSTKSPAVSSASVSVQSPAHGSSQLVDSSTPEEPPSVRPPSTTTPSRPPGLPALDHDRKSQPDGVQTNGIDHSLEAEEPEDEESIYHLPESLRDLVSTYESARDAAANLSSSSPEHQRLLNQSLITRPDANDAERPQHYRPNNLAAYTPPHYPQDPSPIFNNPRLYERIDTDSLFYSFYYRQGSYQQYLAAKALKANSWRFHKQYQTWFQRHEEPKTITEDYEQGTYRFFDYESTW
ncbi:MAG: hypothetical protein Q9162_004324 [Coniocarpon cinnabarinum]